MALIPRKRFTTSILIGCVLLALWYLHSFPDHWKLPLDSSNSPVVETPPMSKTDFGNSAPINPTPPVQQSVSWAAPDATAQMTAAPQFQPDVSEDILLAPLRTDQDTIQFPNNPPKPAVSHYSPASKASSDSTEEWETTAVPKVTNLPAKANIPKLQHIFEPESAGAKSVRLERLKVVQASFAHAWHGYKDRAWMSDELSPISGGAATTFGGWAATLVDSLDSLWLMGMLDDFEEAVREVKNINFNITETDTLNLFETTIRYLGGLLGAYDLSDANYPILLEKAEELGNMLFCAFETPNKMPMTRFSLKDQHRQALNATLLAEFGSLSLEFTRLSRLTEDQKYFDAIQRITDALDASQKQTALPGLWPIVVNAQALEFDDTSFTLGGMADSAYEYLPKQHVLLGGSNDQYKKLYLNAIEPIKKHIFFRPMTPENANILISGSVYIDGTGKVELQPGGQHLSCFTGGMVGIGAKIFNRPEELPIARKLVDGCIWAYNATATGIMPEVFKLVPCDDRNNCQWNQDKWYAAIVGRPDGHHNLTLQEKTEAQNQIETYKFPPGFYDIQDRSYKLRPEAIESVFIMYRLTGDPTLMEAAWKMFTTIENHTRTNYGHAGLKDVMNPDSPKDDKMESFWLAETLKYFALIFSEPNVISLDDWVL